ncbi:MAG: adenylyltransferase/cytidyltransferase family protein [Methylococcaceae bacterium]|nr:adenylyltransferase/cytidyltransferase family protein [Methylococcaceae bacterium]
MKTKNIGILGSAFNPPHFGHKDIIEQVYQNFDEIILIPSFHHPFNKIMEPYQDRLCMTSMLAQSFQTEKSLMKIQRIPIVTSSIERELGNQTNSPVYTYNVLKELEQRYLNTNIKPALNFIIGPDNATEKIWSKFYKGEEIIERWNLTIVHERIPIRSSLIREQFSYSPESGLFFESHFAKYLEKPIANYIFSHHLYGVNL